MCPRAACEQGVVVVVVTGILAGQSGAGFFALSPRESLFTGESARVSACEVFMLEEMTHTTRAAISRQLTWTRSTGFGQGELKQCTEKMMLVFYSNENDGLLSGII